MPTHDSLMTNMQGSTELSGYIECKKVPKPVLTSHVQPCSPPKKAKNEDQSPGRLIKAVTVTHFKTKEFSSIGNELLTAKLQGAAKLEQVEPVVVEGLLMTKVPIEFKARRLKEHMKPTRVEVEELKMLTGSPKAKRLADEEIVDSHRAPQHTNHTKSRVIARRIRIEEPSRLVTQRKLLEEILQVEMLKHMCRSTAGQDRRCHLMGMGHEEHRYQAQWLRGKTNGYMRVEVPFDGDGGMRSADTEPNSSLERQWTVKEKLHNKIQWHYYEWGKQSEQAEGTTVVLFFSFSMETTPEEIINGRAMQEWPYDGYEAWWRQMTSLIAQGPEFISGYATHIFIILAKANTYNELQL
ncbi:hypothetical protein F5J12DRAFT_786018 [Pisolithus orientalis]|uniref:uncharacterized protein n=1 Tax=Pisolithus orientalis TaxID=936130 RepID=UPI0022258018|nr:uncharacterized protein F5J12DRAFT_786018 [Pisolithus orientalis]KAI5993142.1 hypothetical protein F5J12DRAFT_786018 [Pisolithus orientalis]